MKKIIFMFIILFFLAIIIGIKICYLNNKNYNLNSTSETELMQSYNIYGTYEYDNYPEDYYCFRLLYVFENGYVKTMSDATLLGTYTIEGNKLYINYYKAITPDGNPMDLPIKERTFTIIDNATLVSDEGYSIKRIENDF